MIAGEIGPEELLTSSEVGVLLQVNPSSVKKWVNEGRIVAFRTPGGHRRIRASDLVAFLNLHKIPVPRSLHAASKKRVLLVDDEPALLRALTRSLRRYAQDVEIATSDNGIDALVRVGFVRPSLVVLDVYMPGVDGIEVCRRLKANPDTRDIAVIVTSAHMTPQLAADAVAAGARRALLKPIETSVLLEELGIIHERAP